MENDKLYIPYGLKTDTEIFQGFGKKQIKQSAIGISFFVVIAIILYAITATVAVVIVTIIIGIAGSVMMTMNDNNNSSVVGTIADLINFNKSQQKFEYIYKDLE